MLLWSGSFISAIENDLKGRAWGLIGFISQMGYVIVYAVSGLLADYCFTPLLMPRGLLANTVGKIFGTGAGCGIGFLIALAGILLGITAILLFSMKSIHGLEDRGVYEK